MIKIAPWIALAFVLATGGAWWLGVAEGRAREGAERDLAAETARANAQTLEARAAGVALGAIWDAGKALAQQIQRTRTLRESSTREIIRYVTANPSPAACVLPAAVVRVLNDQIRATHD